MAAKNAKGREIRCGFRFRNEEIDALCNLGIPTTGVLRLALQEFIANRTRVTPTTTPPHALPIGMCPRCSRVGRIRDCEACASLNRT